MMLERGTFNIEDYVNFEEIKKDLENSPIESKYNNFLKMIYRKGNIKKNPNNWLSQQKE